MIISFNGDLGSGKSTIAGMVSEFLGYPRFTMGQIFRDMAKNQGMTLEEFHGLCDEDSAVDKQVDDYVVELSMENNNFVIESRNAWKFIPNSLKIYLKVDESEAAKRVFNESNSESRKNESHQLTSVGDVLLSLQKRKKRDDERYMRYYGLNGREEKNYDLVVDTTNLSVEEVFAKVIDYVKTKLKV